MLHFSHCEKENLVILMMRVRQIQKFPDPDESGCQYVMDSNELYQSHPELNFECDVDELIEQSELDRENEYQHY